MVYKLNEILIGWLNYYSITKVTHIWDTVSQIKWHLDYKLYKWLKSKGRKAHKALRQRPFDNLVKYKNLLDIEKYASLKFHAKATGRTLSVSRIPPRRDVRFDAGGTDSLPGYYIFRYKNPGRLSGSTLLRN